MLQTVSAPSQPDVDPTVLDPALPCPPAQSCRHWQRFNDPVAVQSPEHGKVYYVLDCLCWNGHAMTDCNAEFRIYWCDAQLLP